MTEQFREWADNNLPQEYNRKDGLRWLRAFVKEVERRRTDHTLTANAFYAVIQDFGLEDKP